MRELKPSRLEFEPDAEADLPGRLVHEAAGEVLVVDLEAGFGPVVVLQHALTIEHVEGVHQHHEAARAEVDAVISVDAELAIHWRPRLEAVLRLEALATRRFWNLTPTVIHRVRGKRGQR